MLLARASEICPLAPFVEFGSKEEQKSCNEGDPPFVSQPGMLEDLGVDDRDIKQGEHEDEAADD